MSLFYVQVQGISGFDMRKTIQGTRYELYFQFFPFFNSLLRNIGGNSKGALDSTGLSGENGNILFRLLTPLNK